MKAKLQDTPDEFSLGEEIPSFYLNNDPEKLRYLMRELTDFAHTFPPEGMKFWLDVVSKLNHHRENIKRAVDMVKKPSK